MMIHMDDFINIFSSSDPSAIATSVKLLLLLTVLSIAPGILILMTSFTRIIVVLSFVRTSLATQQMPPNQVLIGIALFLTFFIMAPTFQEVYDEALQPLFDEEITLEDRKSTRLNSSHVAISYAVFCLKKKKQTKRNIKNHTYI